MRAGVFFVLSGALVAAVASARTSAPTPIPNIYENRATRDLVGLVTDAASLVHTRGEAAFDDFRLEGSPWRRGETYVFVIDLQGKMLVHPDATMEGKNERNLKDVNGKPIVRGLLAAATASPEKPEGWYHYEWPTPGSFVARWKSSYVRLVTAPDGRKYVVGAGMYDDRMERAFAVDLVQNAVAEIEKHGEDAYPLLRDPKGPFIVKDSYVFVIDADGIERVNPGFPSYEGRPVLDVQDAQGKFLNREMFSLIRRQGSGWVDYMWPKPGESAATRKSAFVSRAKMGDSWVLVGCGVYLEDAPKVAASPDKLTAPQLQSLVRDAAALLERDGERAFGELGQKGSRWFRDDTYLFVWDLGGVQVFNAGEPATNGQNRSGLKDIRGRPIGQMILQVATSDAGEGWIHYLYPKPGGQLPSWKSTFVKRVRFPSGKEYAVGAGVYDLQMDRALVEDVVNRAADLVAARGADAFPLLRDKTGPFVFVDTYVFVDRPDGTELVNPGMPSVEGKNLWNEQDAEGRFPSREYIGTAMKQGSGWVRYLWFKPGHGTPVPKDTFVRRVQAGTDTYIVGAGLYPEEPVPQKPVGRRP